jgi:hypothetical protein
VLRQSAIIDKIRDIPDCPTHVAQVARDLLGSGGEEGENIIVAALLDANMRSYEAQSKVLSLLERQGNYTPQHGQLQLQLPGLAG